MKNFRSVLSIIFSISILVCQSACDCQSCNVRHETQGASLRIHDSSAIRFYKNIHIEITEETTSKNTGGKCFNKKLIVCRGAGLSAEKMNLFCDKELVLKTMRIPAGKNLFEADPSPLDTLTEGMLNLDFAVDDSFEQGVYTFFLEGATNDSKRIADTVVLYY